MSKIHRVLRCDSQRLMEGRGRHPELLHFFAHLRAEAAAKARSGEWWDVQDTKKEYCAVIDTRLMEGKGGGTPSFCSSLRISTSSLSYFGISACIPSPSRQAPPCLVSTYVHHSVNRCLHPIRPPSLQHSLLLHPPLQAPLPSDPSFPAERDGGGERER